MRELTAKDFSFGKKVTVKLLGEEEAVFVIDRSKEAKAMRGKNVSPIVLAVAGTVEEMDAIERQYLSYKYRTERIRYNEQKEQESIDRYRMQSDAVLPSLEPYFNILMAARPDGFEGMKAHEIFPWLEKNQTKLDMEWRVPFEQAATVLLYPAALIIREKKVNVYDMGFDFYAEIPEAEPRVAVNVFSCLPETFMVSWDDPDEGPEFFLVNAEEIPAEADGKKQVQMTFWEFSEYSEKTQDFMIVPHSGGVFKSGETARESTEKMLREVDQLAQEIGIDAGLVRDMLESNAGLKNSNSKTDALMRAIYKIVDNDIEPTAVASLERK